MPFFPLGLHLHHFWGGGRGFSELKISRFFCLPFIILLQWLTFYWVCFQFKKFWESIIIKTCKFYHGVTMCSRRQFCAEFFGQLSVNFCANFRLHWANQVEDLLQNLSTDDANFGQRWWLQKRNEGKSLSWLVTASTGVNGLRAKCKLGCLW